MPSPFASLIASAEIPLPFDEGQWVKVRKLTGRQYEQAQTAHREGAFRTEKWSGLFRLSLEHGITSEQVQQAMRDPLTGFDRYELVTLGLVAWSYDRAIEKASIDDLDDDAIEFIAREVLKVTKPGLFAEQPAEAEKKSA